MRLAILMALQTTAPGAPAAPVRIDPSGFDLATVPARPCGEEGGEIVICGRRNTPHRLTPLPAEKERRLPRAETGLFGKVRAGVEVEQATLAGGVVSNRAMLRFKLPF